MAEMAARDSACEGYNIEAVLNFAEHIIVNAPKCGCGLEQINVSDFSGCFSLKASLSTAKHFEPP